MSKGMQKDLCGSFRGVEGLQLSFSLTDKRKKPFQVIFLSLPLLPALNMDMMSGATAA